MGEVTCHQDEIFRVLASLCHNVPAAALTTTITTGGYFVAPHVKQNFGLVQWAHWNSKKFAFICGNLHVVFKALLNRPIHSSMGLLNLIFVEPHENDQEIKYRECFDDQWTVTLLYAIKLSKFFLSSNHVNEGGLNVILHLF